MMTESRVEERASQILELTRLLDDVVEYLEKRDAGDIKLARLGTVVDEIGMLRANLAVTEATVSSSLDSSDIDTEIDDELYLLNLFDNAVRIIHLGGAEFYQMETGGKVLSRIVGSNDV